jgi:transcriptional/translational regulatory protein YebC/TACO1
LERAYEGCDSDLQDLRLMRRSLHFFQDAFKQLSSEVLTESDFEKLAKSLEEKGIQEFGKEELPWIPEKTIAIIVKHISNIREYQGKEWMGEIEPLIERIISMDITEANDLYKKISNPPLFISSTQKKQLSKLLDKVEDRLNVINIDWLVKRYEELDNSSRKKFLQLIGVKIQLNN